MGEAGILGEDDRLELIDGEIVTMPPIGSRHAGCVKRLNALFGSALAGRVVVSAQDPLVLDDYSEPQPDIVLLRPRPDYYASAHPRPEDVLLLVEVADSSLDYDEDVKVPRYARAGVQEMWIVDLEHARVLVWAGGETRTLQPGETLAPSAFPEVCLSVARILGLDLGEQAS